MKRSLLLITIIGAWSLATCAKVDSEDIADTGRSFLAIRRTNFEVATPERVTGFRYEQVHAKEEGCNGAFQAVVFGSKTTNSCDLAAYFSPFGVERLRVSENTDRELVGNFELYSPDFGVVSPATDNQFYYSTLCFSPEHSEVGVGLEVRKSFWRNEESERGFFIDIAMPIMRVRNDMNLKENIVDQAGAPLKEYTSPGGLLPADEIFPTFGSMRAAFDQSSWKFGKITCDSDELTKTGVPWIQALIGYEWLQHHPYHLETYVGISIPTGNSVTGEYLFEPVLGYGKCFGLVWGSALGLHIWDHKTEDRHIRMEVSNHAMYLFQKEQTRPFDLKGRPWSRYLPVYVNQEQAQEAFNTGGQAGTFLATPGINVFTQNVDVTPGLSHTINTGFVFEMCKWRIEAGYNFFACADENVELCGFPKDVAIRAFQGLGQTMPLRDIASLVDTYTIPPVPLADYETSIITPEDLDLSSAATPGIISNTLYGNVGYHADDRETPLFGNIGFSYEFSESSKAVPQRWALWAKFGVSF